MPERGTQGAAHAPTSEQQLAAAVAQHPELMGASFSAVATALELLAPLVRAITLAAAGQPVPYHASAHLFGKTVSTDGTVTVK